MQYHEIESDMQSFYCGVPQGSILGTLLFSIMINDIKFALQKSEIILYADDAVIYFSDRSASIIQKELNEEVNQVDTWGIDNKLIINSNIAKTECVLFGTNRNTTKTESFEISMNGCSIPNVGKSEYLGVVMDKSLNLTGNLEKMIKKASSRVKMLSRIRHNTSPYAAEKIYNLKKLLIMIYCSSIIVGMPASKKQKVEIIQQKALSIINGKGKNYIQLLSVNYIHSKRCSIEVFKCLSGTVPTAFEGHFKRNCNTGMNTRGNNKSVVIPKVKSANGKTTFMFQDAKVLIMIPSEIQDSRSLLFFKSRCKDFDFDF